MDTSKLQLLRVPENHEQYDEATALALVAVAKGQTVDTWPERRLAVLLLENQLIRLKPENLNEFDLVLFRLGLKPEVGHDVPLRTAVLKEGFSSLDLQTFVVELLQKLRRLDRVHNQLRHAEHDETAWSYFVRASRDISKLTLARYVFTAEEVAGEIIKNLVVSEGTLDTTARLEGQGPNWTEALRNVPEFEADLLKTLCAGRRVYWVSELCSSEINSLVEYPLTSAVVVIKPPGSDFEFEIKRAGTRGPRLLNVITERDGKDSPTSHRLFGGSLGWLAKREAESAALFSKIYWLVHGKECPCSRTVMNSSIVSVQAPAGETHILDYLTDEQQFGEGFDSTRRAMQVCVESFPSDTGVVRANYEGDTGLTLQFIGQALPLQAIIIRSSSFRLDRLYLYLSDSGADEYFQTGLGRGYSDWEARWFADSVLEEILGTVTPPRVGFVNYGQYVRDAFNVPENRRRADANYMSVMKQMGECWGTLLALRGFSDGESFVQRNVGLKSVWSDGEWQIRVIFMDHDDLTVAGYRYKYLWPSREAAGMLRDQVHLLGGPLGDQIIHGDVNALTAIYRIDSATGDAGVKLLEESLVDAYDKTESKLSTNRELQDLFYPEFINRFADFDEIAGGYLRAAPSEVDAWKSDAAAYLRAKTYDDELIAESIDAICRCRDFFERMRFLYCR